MHMELKKHNKELKKEILKFERGSLLMSILRFLVYCDNSKLHGQWTLFYIIRMINTNKKFHYGKKLATENDVMDIIQKAVKFDNILTNDINTLISNGVFNRRLRLWFLVQSRLVSDKYNQMDKNDTLSLGRLFETIKNSNNSEILTRKFNERTGVDLERLSEFLYIISPKMSSSKERFIEHNKLIYILHPHFSPHEIYNILLYLSSPIEDICKPDGNNETFDDLLCSDLMFKSPLYIDQKCIFSINPRMYTRNVTDLIFNEYKKMGEDTWKMFTKAFEDRNHESLLSCDSRFFSEEQLATIYKSEGVSKNRKRVDHLLISKNGSLYIDTKCTSPIRSNSTTDSKWILEDLKNNILKGIEQCSTCASLLSNFDSSERDKKFAIVVTWNRYYLGDYISLISEVDNPKDVTSKNIDNSLNEENIFFIGAHELEVLTGFCSENDIDIIKFLIDYKNSKGVASPLNGCSISDYIYRTCKTHNRPINNAVIKNLDKSEKVIKKNMSYWNGIKYSQRIDQYAKIQDILFYGSVSIHEKEYMLTQKP